MAEITKIEWTGATWNPITGCSIKSCGCNGCYAMGLAATRLQHHPSRAGLTMRTKAGPVWTGEVRFNEGWLDQPIRWKEAKDIFVVAHGDLFHENVPFEWIDRVMAAMVLAPQHRYQVLTKRTGRMLEYFSGGRDLYQRVIDAARPLRDKHPRLTGIPIDDPGLGAWHKNIWLGTSVERQQEASERRQPLEALAREYGWRTWVSYEPGLGMVDWPGWEFIRWLVAGGESGAKARPSHPDWHRAARDFCVAHGIPFFFKQNGAFSTQRPSPFDGEWGTLDRSGQYWPTTTPWNGLTGGDSETGEIYVYRVGKKAAGHLLDSREWRQMPEAQ